MFENMSGIKAKIEKETPPEFNLSRRDSEFTAAGVYHSIQTCIHAIMQPCNHAKAIFQISYHPSPHSPNSPISLHSIIPVVSAANLGPTWETGQLYYEFEIFEEYMSIIFFEINREIRGENLRK
jgi:hypothetical protein